MSDTSLGDTQVRAALADAGKWARLVASVVLVVSVLGLLAAVGSFFVYRSGALPADLTDQLAEAFATAGYDALPVELLLLVGVLGIGLNVYAFARLLAFGRALKHRAEGHLADADVGRSFDHLAGSLQAIVGYQMISLLASIGLLVYGLASG